MTEHHSNPEQTVRPWQMGIYDTFASKDISHVSYVPDGGHKGLISVCQQSDHTTRSVLTTEEEGIGIKATFLSALQNSRQAS